MHLNMGSRKERLISKQKGFNGVKRIVEFSVSALIFQGKLIIFVEILVTL